MLLLKILNIYDRMLILLYKALRCFVGFIHIYTCTFQFYFIFYCVNKHGIARRSLSNIEQNRLHGLPTYLLVVVPSV